MHEQPLVSIIIPTYNRAHFIGETLDSVLAQTYTNWECIVVDDGSTDGTDEVLAEYVAKDSRFQYHHRPKDRPKGANACRNYGFELSNGEFVNWFDDDDLMFSNKIESQLFHLKYSLYNFCVCNSIKFTGQIINTRGLRHERLQSKNNLSSYLRTEIVWLTSNPLFKRSFLNLFDTLFDEELQAAQEWEFFIRVLDYNSIYIVLNKPLVYLREHSNSITYRQDKRLFNYFLARKKIYFNTKLTLLDKDLNYLREYLLNSYKYFVRDRDFNASYQAFRGYVLKDKTLTITVKFNAFLSLLSYLVFNRGDRFLKRITL